MKTETETKMELGKRASYAEVAGSHKGKKETEYHSDDFKDRMYQLIRGLGDKPVIETGSTPLELLSTAKQWLVEFQELKEEERVRNSVGREEGEKFLGEVQPLLHRLSKLSLEISNQLADQEKPGGSNDTMKVDLAMGNSKKGCKRKGKEARKAAREEKMRKGLEEYEEWKRKNDEERRLHHDPEELTDPYAYQARLFEKRWNMSFAGIFGQFEDNTSIPSKRYTINPAPYGGFNRDTLQVFSIKVAELTGGLQCPLNVFGMVALRDSLDHNRNIIFKRERDNCQTVTNENPYLVLTGPVRGVVLGDPVDFEVLLYVRGTTEPDDKELSLVAASFGRFFNPQLNSSLITKSFTSRLSTLDFELGHIACSVEATISVKVISGPADGFHGEFTAYTDVLKCEVILHNSSVEELHHVGDEIKLSRSVISVESWGKLMVSVRASDGSVTSMGTMEFKPAEKGITTGELYIADLCQLEISVAWSRFS